MSDQDYYDILGVRRNATDGDIKKAYKKQAMKWHPDRNIKNRYDAEKRFKEVSEAYQVLIDPDKRKIYDKYGKDGLDDTFAFNPDNGFPGFDFEPAQNIFAELFGEQVFPEMFEEETFEGIPTGNYYFTQNIHHNKDSKLKPAEYDLPCTLEELYKGKERSFKITRRGLLGPETRVLKIDVKPGWKEGTKITFASEGDIVLNHPPRDVVFIVKEKPHKDFKRKGNDLVIRIKISLNQALTGCTKRVKIITGSYKMVKVPRLKSSTETKIIKGFGMPIRKNGQFRGYGDLIVKFDIILD